MGSNCVVTNDGVPQLKSVIWMNKDIIAWQLFDNGCHMTERLEPNKDTNTLIFNGMKHTVPFLFIIEDPLHVWRFRLFILRRIVQGLWYAADDSRIF